MAEVEFSAWTEEGILRHPSFKGLREDKDPREVTLERDEGRQARQRTFYVLRPPSLDRVRDRPSVLRQQALSNPDRVFYPEIGVTKRALAEYYVDIADWIMPHLANRPLTLVRCPQGWEKECFFQKHLADTASTALRSIPIVEKNGIEYYSVDRQYRQGLTELVRIGALEIHVWGSREDTLEQPDMMIFDLDPAPEVEWAEHDKGCPPHARTALRTSA